MVLVNRVGERDAGADTVDVNDPMGRLLAVGAAYSNSLELHTRTGEHTLLLDAVIGTDSNCAGRTQEVYGLHVASVVSDAAMDVYSVPFTGHADGVNAVHGVMSSAARQ